VDFSKIGVSSRAGDNTGESWSQLGDPMRWGSDGSVVVPAQLGTFTSQQLVRVQCSDAYARNWQLVGTLTATELWAISEADLQMYLQVQLSAGQASLVQNFNLRALVDLAAPWYVDGGDGVREVKSWVIAGGIIGHALAARLVVRTLNAVHIETTHTVGVTALVSPYAAGFPL
jgi:hypothetical protein